MAFNALMTQILILLSLMPSGTYHDVFLSFRGKDTRKSFTDHLYTALTRAGIHTFRDDDGIRRGENIELEIKKAIREAKLSIIVFSKDYASSRWCLDELVMIMERRRTVGHKVLPVFYDVHPYEVGWQTRGYGEAFAEHEIRFKDELERVEGWREALKEVAYMEEGMVLDDGYESQFVESILQHIANRLNTSSAISCSSPAFPVFFFCPLPTESRHVLKERGEWVKADS